MDVSVVIVNYNVKYFLEQTLLSVIRATQHLAVEIIVVDNNSVDGSVEMVQQKFPQLTLIANRDNPGFSKANNQAIRISKGRYVLLLNPDTVIEEDTLVKCVAFMDIRPDIGALGVKMIDGSGKFLPESKRGFPSPFVAFAKAFGLSKLFPKSHLFNRYHLGFLDPDENHEIEVLAGAFMFLRKEALNKVGLLDEAFFMYGEDIDLSYRIVQGGYKNYYLSDTTIIHYKGESTKKGSLNYVRVFYQAMIIFARKHFQTGQARLYILMLQAAVYFRAFITIVGNTARKAFWPLLDAGFIFLGMMWLKDFWSNYYFNNPDYYQDTFLFVNVPLYILIWLASIFFSGGYDEPYSLRRLARGLLVGTLILAAVYGFLDLAYRPSRVLIVLGAIWALLTTMTLRLCIHFIRHGNFKMGLHQNNNLVIVGSADESDRVQQLLMRTGVMKNFIGKVFPGATKDRENYLSDLSQLKEVVDIYKVDEIIFCSKDIRSQDIIRWMTRLGPAINYKIVPRESLSIIGSHSKDSSGELYTVDIQFQISTSMARRNKRLLDVLFAMGFILVSLLIIWFVHQPLGFFKNILLVLLGRRTWVGYGQTPHKFNQLPPLRPSVLTPTDALTIEQINEPTKQRLFFFYAKDYTVATDMDIILKSFRRLGK